MSKHEAPPFRMVIEGGKLVPATPYDAERLDSYRRGTKVAVRFTEEKDRVLVRKWWAVLGLVVKQCKTPWKTKDEASEAIKLALGIVNLTKTIGGDYLAYPKSLTELDDPELQEAVDQMMALVERMTGVDPETLRKEIAHVGEDNPQSSDPSTDEGSAEASPSPSPAADLSLGDDPSKEEGDNPGQVTTEQAAPSSTYSRADCVKAFMRTATDPDLDITGRRGLLAEMKDWWKDALSADLDFVKACLSTADKVAKGELQEAAARTYLDAIPAPKGGD